MQQRDWSTAVAALVLLAFSLTGALLLVSLAPEMYRPWTVVWFVGLAVVAAVLRWFLSAAGRGSVRGRLLFWAHTALAATLVLLNPLFGLYGFYGYVDASRLARGRELAAGVAATAVVCALSQTGGPPSALFTPLFIGLFTAVNLAIAGAMARADRGRQRHTEELERAHASLMRAQEDNSALQAELVAQARDTGVAEERARLAREIHDTVAQDLVAIIAQLGAVSSTDDAAERERRLELVHETARKALAEARRSVRALSSP
ncbi:histidine kinase, partial [Tessaracoccus lubricantis]